VKGERKGPPQDGRHTGRSGEVDEASFDVLGKEEGRREDVIRQEGVCLEMMETKPDCGIHLSAQGHWYLPFLAT
jgi:hypothetical protein